MINYYHILRVPPDAKPRDITIAYRILAKQYHPDRQKASGEETSTSVGEVSVEAGAPTMAQINEAYECLRDPDKRRVYDLKGHGEESEFGESVLEADDIENFVANYQGSDMERDDVREFVKLKKGDVSQILEYIPMSTSADLDRLLEIAKSVLGRSAAHKAAYEKSCKKVMKNKSSIKKSEKKEKQKFDKEHGAESSFKDLVAKIKANQQKRKGKMMPKLTSDQRSP